MRRKMWIWDQLWSNDSNKEKKYFIVTFLHDKRLVKPKRINHTQHPFKNLLATKTSHED